MLTKTAGYITVDIPPVTLPTPLTATRWLCLSVIQLYQSTVVRGLLLVLFGVVCGYYGNSLQRVTLDNPPIVRPVTETLESFAAREAKSLTAEERLKLITVTEKILRQHFETPSAIREEFRWERRLAGIDSPAFDTFSQKWETKVEATVVDSVEAMRLIYESLLQGLKVQAYDALIDEYSTGGSVEGFFTCVSHRGTYYLEDHALRESNGDLGGDWYEFDVNIRQFWSRRVLMGRARQSVATSARGMPA